jgi:hypothetical protein
MENFAVRFADLLESVADRVRSMTVDRLSKAVTLIGIGLGAGLLAFIALVFIVVALFRLLSIPIGVTPAYAVFGGLFLIAGALVWRMRTAQTKTGESNG